MHFKYIGYLVDSLLYREAGPLMVSPTGQFIVPSTLPGALLVNFITKNLQDAKQKNIEYQRLV